MKRIPISKAKEIANQYGYEKVIILAITTDSKEDRFQFWLTTYGKNKKFCGVAKQVGEFFIRVLNHPGLHEDPKNSILATLRELKQ